MSTLGLKSTHKSPNIRPIIGGFASLCRTLSNAALVLSAVLLMCAVTERGARCRTRISDLPWVFRPLRSLDL